MRKGDAFLIIDPPSTGTNHLRIIVTDPDPVGEVLVVGVTTWKPDSDESCILNPGDHPFIRHLSRIAYERAHMCSVAVIETAIRNKSARTYEAVSPDVLRRIRDGALATDALPRKLKRQLHLWDP